MPTPDTKHSLVVTKSFSYRGSVRTWTNRYHFEGDLPADRTAWQLLADHVTDAEKLIYTPDVTITKVDGYNAGTATSTNPHGDEVFTTSYTKAGTADLGVDDIPAPGDCAILLRYDTAARSTKNHPVYLSNYFHGVRQHNTGGDQVAVGQVTLVQTYADSWIAGFTDGTGPRERCGPRGAAATGRFVHPEVRHRDFPS